MSLADRDKADGHRGGAPVPRGRVHASSPPPAPPTRSRPTASPSTTRVAKVGEPTGTDAVELISSGKVQTRRQQPAGSRRPRRRRPHPRRGRGARASRASPRRPPGWRRPTASSTAPPTSSRVRTLQEFHARHRPRPTRSCRSTHDARRGAARRRPRRTTVGSVTLPNPVMTASGTSGHGAELAPYVDLGVARRRGGEVAVRRAVGGQPAAAGARDRRPG